MNEKMIPEETFRYALESMGARYERTIRRLIIAFTTIILFLLTIAVLIIYNYDIETTSYEQDAERNRKILWRRLIDGICFEPLAEEFDMSVRQIKRIVYKYGDIIFKNLK